ncbi:hypothetical protein AYI70_g3055 [Smittium culicis]|uniref:Integrase zinc-binding domain-containing protein n=1 Tax=Smittium culicis TaxID=133412 RepID=A0A1R1Y5H2_9FUNG|nr:hypothetical protein AYI70_g3055 [Smittium culicis]
MDQGIPLPEINDRARSVLLKNTNEFVYDKDNEIVYKKHINSCVPYIISSARADTVWKFHRSYGHLAPKSHLEILNKRVWWPSITKDVHNWLKICPECQISSNLDKEKHYKCLHSLEIPGPFQRWEIDFIGILPKTKNHNKWLIVAADYATNWPIVKATKEETSQVASDFN